jgi:transcriptional regulator GlxA family with amidase domain
MATTTTQANSALVGKDPRKSKNAADSSEKQYRFGFLIVPNFTLIGFASATEPLRMANMVAKTKRFQWVTITADGQSVAASNGVHVMPDCSIENAPLLDALFVCGPNPIPLTGDQSLIAWLRKLSHEQVPLGGICTGSHLLARAGLLSGYRCTIHWEDTGSLIDEFGGIVVSGRVFELDRDRYTCSGGIAPIDMMVTLIATQPGGKALAATVAELLVCERIRTPSDMQRIPLRQKLGTSQPKLSEAVALMESNLEEPLTVDELANYVGLSGRQLERLFNEHLNCTPGNYYLELRLLRARQLLLRTEQAIIDVADACGFASVAHFTRRYSEYFGIPPGKERRLGIL